MNTTTTTEDNTKVIACPDCGNEATMFVFPHHWAGIWECPTCQSSDNCEHESVTVEKITVLSTATGSDKEYDSERVACDNCGREVL